jgi:hypothetical protein
MKAYKEMDYSRTADLHQFEFDHGHRRIIVSCTDMYQFEIRRFNEDVEINHDTLPDREELQRDLKIGFCVDAVSGEVVEVTTEIRTKLITFALDHLRYEVEAGIYDAKMTNLIE